MNNLSTYLTITLLGVASLWGCNTEPKTNDQVSHESRAVLVIHGGAGSIKKGVLNAEQERAYFDALSRALTLGYAVLDSGGSSVQAVIAAIQYMESDSLFNAGVGAVFTHEETNELDASIMDGRTLDAGAVAGVKRIKSPIEAAYHVMVNSPHVLLSGEGAETFAQSQGLEMVDPSYFHTKSNHDRIQKVLEREQNKTAYTPYANDWKFGTVGCVALDQNGHLAAGTSTGGMTNKRWNRIGDSPIIGAGTYADDKTCAVSCTGHGEFFIRYVVAYDIAARMKYQNKGLNQSANEVIDELKEKEGLGGVICLDAHGNISAPFNTDGMFTAVAYSKDSVEVFVYGKKR